MTGLQILTQPKCAQSFWTALCRCVLTVAAIAVLVGGVCYGYYCQQKRIVFDEKHNELATIANLKTAQILQWRKERLNEATSIYTNAMISHRVNDYVSGIETPRAFEEIRRWMKNQHDFAGYGKVSLFRANGALITSVSDDGQPLTGHYRAMVREAAQGRQVAFSDFHRDEPGGAVDIDIVVPIMYAGNDNSSCLAVLVLDIDPHHFLYPLIQSWPTASRTGETLLVERDGNDVLFLNELRFRNFSALSFRRPLAQKDMPASRAALGYEGICDGVDYRGVSVLSVSRRIPGSPWALVAKVDTREVMEPVIKRVWYVAGACIMLVVALGLAVTLWWTRRKEIYLLEQCEIERRFNRELKEAEQSLQEAHSRLEQRVSERTRELSDANDKLRQEIAERGRLEQQLIDAKKLESVGQLAGGVAHEVRNPLNAILTITEALFKETEIESNPDYAPYIQHIRAQVKRLAHLMNDLLELGKTIPASNLHPVSLYELCRDTLALWQSSGMAENRLGLLEADHEAATTLVLADSLKLQQIIFNLLENAGHHSPAGISILLSLPGSAGLVSSDGMAIVRVTDAGKGIPEERLSRVFDPFYSDRKGGTGLGLALVRHFIGNMGGTARLWNNDPPPGCTAEIRIPLVSRAEH
jgi:signal transduction histidine kinase